MHNGIWRRNSRLTSAIRGCYIGRRESDMEKEKRKFLGVMFECCKAYARLYINKEKTAYAGRCPRCSKTLEVKIGPGGTDTRFFTAS